MAALYAVVELVADSDLGVLLRGESGVGKDVVAHALHHRSSRCHRPFVKVNCAAMPADLLESELFGHERGAFTGAVATRLGLFEAAHGGTIMLDEIGELPPGLQAKILHVLQDGAVTRLGSNRVIAVDARVIAATNRDLGAMIGAGTFREDLYYRLQGIELQVPPLRERREEIPALAAMFLKRYAATYRRPAVRPSPLLMRALTAHLWPGNIRELENTMKRYVVLQDEDMVLASLGLPPVPRALPAPHVPNGRRGAGAAIMVVAPSLPTRAPDAVGPSLHDIGRHAAMNAERKVIAAALAQFNWNRRKAAGHLHVSYKTILNKIKACGITLAEGAD